MRTLRQKGEVAKSPPNASNSFTGLGLQEPLDGSFGHQRGHTKMIREDPLLGRRRAADVFDGFPQPLQELSME